MNPSQPRDVIDPESEYYSLKSTHTSEGQFEEVLRDLKQVFSVFSVFTDNTGVVGYEMKVQPEIFDSNPPLSHGYVRHRRGI